MHRPHELATVSEDELRRYLRNASVLLATAAPPAQQRVALLLRARHWTAAVIAGIDQLLRDAGTADTLDGPLTPGADPVTIGPDR